MTASEDIASWVQRGAVFLWRYEPPKGSLAGWHFSAAVSGCDSLVDLVERLGRADFLAKRTVALELPAPRLTRIPFDHAGRKVVSPRKLRIALNPSDPVDCWRIESDGNEVKLEMGRGQLDKFGNALAKVRSGEGDFSLGPRKPDDQKVWFWWMPRD